MPHIGQTSTNMKGNKQSNKEISKVVECTTELRFLYNPDSKEFIEAISAYREVIEPGASVNDMLSHVANYVLKFGDDRLIEGVGYLAVNDKPVGQPFSGIYLLDGDYQYDFTVKPDYLITD